MLHSGHACCISEFSSMAVTGHKWLCSISNMELQPMGWIFNFYFISMSLYFHLNVIYVYELPSHSGTLSYSFFWFMTHLCLSHTLKTFCEGLNSFMVTALFFRIPYIYFIQLMFFFITAVTIKLFWFTFKAHVLSA